MFSIRSKYVCSCTAVEQAVHISCECSLRRFHPGHIWSFYAASLVSTAEVDLRRLGLQYLRVYNDSRRYAMLISNVLITLQMHELIEIGNNASASCIRNRFRDNSSLLSARQSTEDMPVNMDFKNSRNQIHYPHSLDLLFRRFKSTSIWLGRIYSRGSGH